MEPIDPVRVISNRSTGLMGYEVARAAVRRGHTVTLITGPVRTEAPKGVRVIHAERTVDMEKAVMRSVRKADVLIMAAAVADFRVDKVSSRKIQRKGGVTLRLIPNRDILKSVKKGRLKIKIGFALESGQPRKRALQKLAEKGLDAIVVNSVSRKTDPFGRGKRDYRMFFQKQRALFFKQVTKRVMAGAILDNIDSIML